MASRASILSRLLAACILPFTAAAMAEDEIDASQNDADAAVAEENPRPSPLQPPRARQPVLDALQTKFLRERAEAGDASMQCLYGLALLNGSAGHIDTLEAGRWLKLSAEGGDERGGLEYGKYLYQGLSDTESTPESLRWLKPAAERGSMEAAYFLGASLLAGDGVEHDPVEGEKWLRVAAGSGLVAAQADLGIAYYSGVGGVKKDYEEAARWFTLAAKQGNGDACNKLGVVYRNGYGVRPDPERAILWFAMGANLGDPFAQFNLANSYLHGEWVARNFREAARWHQQAAQRGNTDSQYLMGCFYAEGLGVEKDMGRAREWLVHAERGGHVQAGELLERLWELDDAGDLTPPQPSPPVLVDAAQLLHGFSRVPLRAIGRDKEVVLTLSDDVEVTEAEVPGRYYVTAPGSPGVICCDVVEGELAKGMTVWGVGQGFTGLEGFVRLGGVRPATEDEAAGKFAIPAPEDEAEEDWEPSPE